IKYPKTVLSLENQIIPYVVDGCAFSKYRLPVGKNLRDPMLKWVDPLGEWTIPEGIIEKTVDLCKVLHTNPEVQQELAEMEKKSLVVVGEGRLEEFVEECRVKGVKWDLSGMGKAVNRDARVVLRDEDGVFSVKFHEKSLESVVYEEKRQENAMK
ncbi:hypothetical protein HK104_009313, partial [Borealophlyctis nickersoniae]